MGGLFGGSTPSAPALPAVPPSAAPATLASAATSGAMQNSRARAVGALGQGFDNTIATSPLGTSTAPTTAKSGLLGGS